MSDSPWLACSFLVWIVCLVTLIGTLMSGNADQSAPAVVPPAAAAADVLLSVPPPARVVCFGDSLTFGYVNGRPFPYATRLQALCEQAFGVGTVQVLHMGESGATISEIEGVRHPMFGCIPQ